MPRNNTNPYAPPKEYTKPRLPKYKEPIVDWPSLIIVSSLLFVMITFTLLAISVS
jgi:hypothetical protein